MCCIRRSRAKAASLLIIAFPLLLIITNSVMVTTNSSVVYAYSKLNQVSSNGANSTTDNQAILAKKVHVGDIDIAYKSFGKGDPILLISGSGLVMDAWPPSMLQELSSNHTVIIFNNRGVGNTTSGTKPFSIAQFANDTAGLISALKIQKADVLGFSMGSFIAQELTLLHPEKVNRLILYGASCGGKEGIPKPSGCKNFIGLCIQPFTGPRQDSICYIPSIMGRIASQFNPSRIQRNCYS